MTCSASPTVFLQCADALITPYLMQQLASCGEFISRDEYQSLSAEQQAALNCRVDCLIAIGRSVISAQMLAEFPQLKLIAICGAGYDRIDLAECRRRAIAVSNTPYISSDDVADHAMWLILSCLRQGIRGHLYVVGGQWAEGRPVPPLTIRVSGKKIGIAGLGHIGREIAKRAQGFKMLVGYYSRTKKDCPYAYFDSLTELAKWCDILVVAMSANQNNYHVINDAVLEALGKNGWLINIARGSLVDEKSLKRRVLAGELAGCGLDVFESEPWKPQQNWEGCVFSPHSASASIEARTDMSDLVMRNISMFFADGSLETPVI